MATTHHLIRYRGRMLTAGGVTFLKSRLRDLKYRCAGPLLFLAPVQVTCRYGPGPSRLS
jgi:hypothetical protein